MDANLRNRVWNNNTFKTGATLKSMIANFYYRRRDDTTFQIRTTVKCIAPDMFDSFGYNDTLKAFAIGEGVSFNLSY